jgi:Cu2+-exporting ATPase
MLGDGINDAPVLMQAQISIAMSEAADLTRVSADAVLMNNDLSVLIKVFRHAKKAHLIIRQCLVWAIVYNIICLPLAVSGMVAPYVAAALMSMSSILVVANALRLMRIRTNTVKFATEPQLLTVTA